MLYRKNLKGFAPLVILLIGAAVIASAAGGYLWWKGKTKNVTQVVCTQEAKLCPDGKTSVGRTGPNCEFAECPIENKQTNDNENLRKAEYTFYFFGETRPDKFTLDPNGILFDRGGKNPRYYYFQEGAFGDLNGDGIEEAVAEVSVGYGANIIEPVQFVFSSSGGILKQISYLRINKAVNAGRAPDQLEYIRIIKSISISNGLLHVEYLVTAPGENYHNPSIHKFADFKLKGNNLELQSNRSASATGTLAGKVSIGPICPVETIPPKPECSPSPETYASREFLVLSSDTKKTIASFHADGGGNYSISLPPGSYVVVSAKTGIGYMSKDLPQTIVIKANQTMALNIDVDTGIR